MRKEKIYTQYIYEEGEVKKSLNLHFSWLITHLVPNSLSLYFSLFLSLSLSLSLSDVLYLPNTYFILRSYGTTIETWYRTDLCCKKKTTCIYKLVSRIDKFCDMVLCIARSMYLCIPFLYQDNEMMYLRLHTFNF